MPAKITDILVPKLVHVKGKVKYRSLTKKFISNSTKQRLIIIGVPGHSNLGDQAIAEAEKKFFQKKIPDKEYIEISNTHYRYDKTTIEKYINDNDIILVHGGGFLGNLWIEEERMFRDVLNRFPNNQVIVMPQTIFFDERYNKEEEFEKSKQSYNAHNNLTIFLREKQSYDFVKKHFSKSVNPQFVPDIVTTLEYKSNNNNREDVLMVFRGDKEKVNHSNNQSKIESIIKSKNLKLNYTDTVIPEKVDQFNRVTHLENKWNQFNSSKLTVTDRLHGMIFSLITGTPCIAFDNKSGKVSGVYQWLKEHRYIYCMDRNKEYTSAELENIIDELLNYQPYGYNVSAMTSKFEPLIKEIDQ